MICLPTRARTRFCQSYVFQNRNPATLRNNSFCSSVTTSCSACEKKSASRFALIFPEYRRIHSIILSRFRILRPPETMKSNCKSESGILSKIQQSSWYRSTVLPDISLQNDADVINRVCSGKVRTVCPVLTIRISLSIFEHTSVRNPTFCTPQITV